MTEERLLVDAGELAELLAGPEPPVVADCRFALADPAAGERAWAEAHVPGAHYLHLDRDLSGPRGPTGGRHPLPEAEAFAAVLARIGLGPGRLLVAYDDSRGGFAARLWWLARHFGHPQVCLLDGGWGAWRARGLPLSAAPPETPPAVRRTLRADPSMLIGFDALVADLPRRSLAVVDSRDPPRYAGAEEPIDPVGGHVPGARNLPWSGATHPDGRFLDAAQQRARWEQAGAVGEQVVYCGSGVTACLNLFSRALAGYRGDRLYAGSWSDWCARPGAPVATGPEPG